MELNNSAKLFLVFKNKNRIIDTAVKQEGDYEAKGLIFLYTCTCQLTLKAAATKAVPKCIVLSISADISCFSNRNFIVMVSMGGLTYKWLYRTLLHWLKDKTFTWALVWSDCVPGVLHSRGVHLRLSRRRRNLNVQPRNGWQDHEISLEERIQRELMVVWNYLKGLHVGLGLFCVSRERKLEPVSGW